MAAQSAGPGEPNGGEIPWQVSVGSTASPGEFPWQLSQEGAVNEFPWQVAVFVD